MKQFEYIKYVGCGSYEEKHFLTVLHEITHHYTSEKFYEVQDEYVGYLFGGAYIDKSIISESELRDREGSHLVYYKVSNGSGSVWYHKAMNEEAYESWRKRRVEDGYSVERITKEEYEAHKK